MSLVDFPSSSAEDLIMDPATKQYVDSSLAISEARSDTKLAEFRSIMEAYTARADEREAAARDRETAAREREELRAREVERRMAAFEVMVASVKRTVITSCLAATLTTVFGVAAFNAALLQNIQAAFEQGRLASPAQVELLHELRELRRLREAGRAAQPN